MSTLQDENIIARAMRIMGSRRSPAKTRAARMNAKLGGAPRLYAECTNGRPGRPFHRFSRKGVCYGCGKSKDETRLVA